jgi:hypothetical protein
MCTVTVVALTLRWIMAKMKRTNRTTIQRAAMRIARRTEEEQETHEEEDAY